MTLFGMASIKFYEKQEILKLKLEEVDDLNLIAQISKIIDRINGFD